MFLLTTRFTDDTWSENKLYRARHPRAKCIYGSPHEMSPKIEPREVVCMVEMNNTQNKIMGVGLSEITLIKKFLIYNAQGYNRYVFVGEYYVDRDDLPGSVVKALDTILFKGKTHMKRSSGFTSVPEKLLRDERCEGVNIEHEIAETFRTKFRSSECM